MAPAAAVGLAGDMTAIAGWQDSAAVGTSLEIASLILGGRGENASGEEGEERDAEELHFGKWYKSWILECSLF